MSAKVLSWVPMESQKLNSDESTIFVLAPIGRDGALVVDALSRSGLRAKSVEDVDELCELVNQAGGAAIISEEALKDYAVARLSRMVAHQPAWSDFPLLILTLGHEAGFGQQTHLRFRESLGNYSLLERPIRMETLLRAVTTALRARQKQYEIRDHLEERKRSEAALAKSETRHRLLVTATSAILWVADADGAFKEPQESWQNFTGQPFELHREFGWVQAVHREDRDHLIARLTGARISGGNYYAESRIWSNAHGAYRHFEVRGVSMRNSAGIVQEWVGVGTDIEERKRAEDALRKSEKLASAGRLAATIAHEINNPLEAVTNLLYLARGESASIAECRHYLEMMEHEINRVIHITKQTLAFYRDSSGPTEISMRETLDGLASIYSRKITNKEASVRIHCEQGIHIFANQGEIRQVISNLLSNALDAIPTGGRIRIRVRRSVANGQAGVRISVADNGSGIPPSDRHKIFEPFFTTKEKIGTGLGLWVSRDLVEKNGGKISFRSSMLPATPGTTFSVFFAEARPAVESTM